jgi:hypothetical protein
MLELTRFLEDTRVLRYVVYILISRVTRQGMGWLNAWVKAVLRHEVADQVLH